MNSKSATLISDPLRRGGATYEMQTHGLTEKTLIRGGWKNSNVARLYICDGLAMLPRLCIKPMFIKQGALFIRIGGFGIVYLIF